jgi:hypothetical protein
MRHVLTAVKSVVSFTPSASVFRRVGSVAMLSTLA